MNNFDEAMLTVGGALCLAFAFVTCWNFFRGLIP